MKSETTTRPAYIVACPVEAALHEWARLKREGPPPGDSETTDEYGNTPWEAALIAATDAAVVATPVTHLGALYQMLIAFMGSDMDGSPWWHRAAISGYTLLRSRIPSPHPDMELAEAYYFSGLGFRSAPIPGMTSAADWIAKYEADHAAQGVRYAT